MRENPNGSYTLHLELKPPELGRIELRVEMRDGVMHASIHSDREGSAQMLRDALGIVAAVYLTLGLAVWGPLLEET